MIILFSVKRLSIFTILLILPLCNANHHSTDKDFANILKNIKSYASPEIQARAAKDVIDRTIPTWSHKFAININESLPLNTFQIFKDDSNETIEINASSGVTACKAFYSYLVHFTNSSISWDGNRIEKPINLLNVNITQTSPSRFIYYQNVCTWSYSFTWWQWDDWQRHIDWIAMQGITLTLAPVQEHVWEKVYLELGLTKNEIDDHFSGPSFLAWQRMGNIRGWGGPLSRQYKLSSNALQKKIIKNLRDLGIAVALPAFAGHVPIAFKRIYPNVTFTPVSHWNNFPDEYCCPLFIDPIDPLFQKVGELFLKEIIEEFGGTNHIYFSDPFNELQPRLNTAKYLSETSNSIYKTMKNVDEKAVWLLQAWMFVKNPFWSETQIKAFLTAVPKGRMLVLDLMSEQYPQYIRTKSFYGQPFIWCMLHNFGGTSGMHGSLDIVNEEIVNAHKIIDSTMVGVGITPEGIHQNYVMYEFLLDRAWDQKSVNVSSWIENYIRRRYGFESIGVSSAWSMLRETIYNYKGIIKISGKYTICKRPSLNIKQWTWYNLSIAENILSAFLIEPNNFIYDNSLYKHDLIDITRQMLQNKFDVLYKRMKISFREKNKTMCTFYGMQFHDLLNDLNHILNTKEEFMVGNWLKSATDMASNDLETEMYRFNALNQITIWGPDGQIVDYAMKQWAGIVADYCLPRWKLFNDELLNALNSNSSKFNESKVKKIIFRQIEEPFGVSAKQYPIKPIGDTIEIAKRIYARWKNQLNE